jgi:uncharacterized RDD family membrane protein YckC
MTEPVTPPVAPPLQPPYLPGGAYPPHIPVQPGPYAAYPPRPIPVAPGGVPLADAWARFVAYAIDSVLLMIANLIPIIAAVVVIFDRIRDAIQQIQESNQAVLNDPQAPTAWPSLWHLVQLELIVVAIAVPFALLFSYLYFVEFSYRNGQTVGKKIMNIKVVRAADSGPVTKKIMRRRWLVLHVASLAAPYFSYADCLWLLWDKPLQQCLHDKCADTVVVKSRP